MMKRRKRLRIRFRMFQWSSLDEPWFFVHPRYQGAMIRGISFGRLFVCIGWC